MPDHGTPMSLRRPAMTIKNLIPSLPERGKIKIGKKGQTIRSSRGNEFQPPQKLDHFLVTTLERDGEGNFLRDEAVHAVLGDRPSAVPVRLLYDDPALNFPTRYACYKGRTLWCSGDGEVAARVVDAPRPGEPTHQSVACPCHRQQPGYSGPDKCKMNGSLSVLLENAGGIGGVWKFRTTSYNTIVGLLSSLSFIRSVTGGPLAGIPFNLVLQPKQVTSPTDGKQQTIYVVSLEYAGTLGQLQTAGHTMALERAKTHLSITHIEDEARRLLALPPPDNAPLPGDVADDVVDEFYPDQAAATPPHHASSSVSGPVTVEIVDLDGEITAFALPEQGQAYSQAFIYALRAAAERGSAAVAGAWETNSPCLAALREAGGDAFAERITAYEAKLYAAVIERERAAPAPDVDLDEGGAADEAAPVPEAEASAAPPSEWDERLADLKAEGDQATTFKAWLDLLEVNADAVREIHDRAPPAVREAWTAYAKARVAALEPKPANAGPRG